MDLTGIHHLTAITADAPGNKRFYTDTLGLRLVKKTVNSVTTPAPITCSMPTDRRHRAPISPFSTGRWRGNVAGRIRSAARACAWPGTAWISGRRGWPIRG
ncbi:VOC family protein [Paracoccus sp. DMF-8]|nr:VOC family protein [Paracoccus sp. DMF-8]MDF3605972.1 VOC family protein [Paracoccus sp. DMF-8]